MGRLFVFFLVVIVIERRFAAAAGGLLFFLVVILVVECRLTTAARGLLVFVVVLVVIIRGSLAAAARGLFVLVRLLLPAAEQTTGLLFLFLVVLVLVVFLVLVVENHGHVRGFLRLFGRLRLGIGLVVLIVIVVLVVRAILSSASEQTAKQAALLRLFLRKLVAEYVLILLVFRLFLVLRFLGRHIVIPAHAHRRKQAGRVVRAGTFVDLRCFRLRLFRFERRFFLGLGLFRRQTRRFGFRLRFGLFRGFGFRLRLLGSFRFSLRLFGGFQRGLLAHAPFTSGHRLTFVVFYGRIDLDAFVGVLFFHRNILLPGNRQRRFGLLRAFYLLLGDRLLRFCKRRGRVLRILLHLGLGCHRFPGGFILLHVIRLVRVVDVSVFLVGFIVLRVLVLFVFLVFVVVLVRLALAEVQETLEHAAEAEALLRLILFFVLVGVIVLVLFPIVGFFPVVVRIDRLAVFLHNVRFRLLLRLIRHLRTARDGLFIRKIDRRLRGLLGRLRIHFFRIL